jgi:hypothetical protein
MDANSPRSRIVVPERTLMKIRQRWLEWQPQLKLEAQVRPSHLCFDEGWHRGWMISLLQQGVAMRQVRRSALDDPRQPMSELQRRVRMYLEKRTRRINNVTSQR